MTVTLPPGIPQHLAVENKKLHKAEIERRNRIRPIAGEVYVKGAGASDFCVEIEPGKIMMRKGKPWLMSHVQACYYCEQLKVNRQPLENDIILNADELPLTDTIQIVAPGPKGVDHYKRLNPDYYTIVVNKACEIQGIRKDLWMVADSNSHVYKESRTKWFQHGLDHHWDIACFDSGYLYEHYPTVKWVFDWGPLVNMGWAEPLPNVLRGGLTITGQAVQLAYWFGCRQVILCGADMADDAYFDGTKTNVNKRAGYWGWVIPRFDEMIKILSRSMDIVSLSPTALNVPVIK